MIGKDQRGLGSFASTIPAARHLLPLVALGVDAALIICSGFLGIAWRQHVHAFGGRADVTDTVLSVGPVIWMSWVVLLAAFGAYNANYLGEGTREYSRVLQGSVATAGATGVGCYLAKFDLSRGFFVLMFAFGIPMLVLGRWALRKSLHAAHRRGRFQQRVLIAGAPGLIDEVARVLDRETWLGYQVVGALTPASHIDYETPSGIPVLGNAEDLPKYASADAVDAVFLAGGAVQSATQMRELVWELEHEDVEVIVAPSVSEISRERVRVRPVAGLPLMHIDPPRSTDAVRWGKRMFDVLGSASLIVLTSPLLAFAALRIKLHDGGPVMFLHPRIGRDGREFECLKFRTMVVNADAMVRGLQEQVGQSALLFKMKRDPRITKPGTWLRKFSIDELPQLFNVLWGDMSLVGPRPQVAREVALYRGAQVRRLQVRPGMTGLWQISGRNDLSLEEAVRLDLYYVDNWSMVQDLTILAKTVGAVLRSRGAY